MLRETTVKPAYGKTVFILEN